MTKHRKSVPIKSYGDLIYNRMVVASDVCLAVTNGISSISDETERGVRDLVITRSRLFAWPRPWHSAIRIRRHALALPLHEMPLSTKWRSWTLRSRCRMRSYTERKTVYVWSSSVQDPRAYEGTDQNANVWKTNSLNFSNALVRSILHKIKVIWMESSDKEAVRHSSTSDVSIFNC